MDSIHEADPGLRHLMAQLEYDERMTGARLIGLVLLAWAVWFCGGIAWFR